MLSPCLHCPIRADGGNWKGDGPPRRCKPGARCPIDPGAPLVATVTKQSATPERGPGTELTKMLGDLGLAELSGCQCKVRAGEMDRRGADWCEANIETIVEWLREESVRQGLGGVFLAWAAKRIVRRAIEKARAVAAA